MILKTFKQYYFITAVILIGAAIVPVWNFLLMLYQYFQYFHNFQSFLRGWTGFNIIAVIPFMAVSVTILFGFLLLPLLINMSSCKSHCFIFLFSTLIFCGLSLFAETIGSRLYALHILMHSRSPRSLDAITELIGSTTIIPATIRFHYYIFSIVLIISILSWLYNFAQTKYANRRLMKRFLTLQGIATVCYSLAYFLVRVVQYENYATRQLTLGSVINAAVCFILAALVMGLWSISFLNFTKYVKLVPPLIAVLTGLLLYSAQYVMLNRQFYLYSNSIFISLLLRNLIVATSGILVYLLLNFVLKDDDMKKRKGWRHL